MVGRDLEHRFPDHTPDIGEVMFEIRDWTVMHPLDHHREVIRKANLNVRAGEIVGIAGLMGAGRTELARSIFGRSYGSRNEGTLILNGKELTLSTVTAAIDAGIAYVSEDRKGLGLNLLDDIKTSISSAALGKLVKGLTVDERKEVLVAEGYRKSLNIKAPSVTVGVSKLSGGNQQKVVLSKWMYTDPQLLTSTSPPGASTSGPSSRSTGSSRRSARTGRGVLVISSVFPHCSACVTASTPWPRVSSPGSSTARKPLRSP